MATGTKIYRLLLYCNLICRISQGSSIETNSMVPVICHETLCGINETFKVSQREKKKTLCGLRMKLVWKTHDRTYFEKARF